MTLTIKDRKEHIYAALAAYRWQIDQMRDKIFYCENEEGQLVRWLPPKRVITDRE